MAQYFAPFGSSDPTASYVNGDPSNGVMGSIPDCRGFESTQREIVAAIAAAGLTPSSSDLTQLLQALRSGVLTFTPDLSTAPDTIVLAPASQYGKPPLPGTVFRFKASFAPTGDTVLLVNNLAPIPVRNPDGSKLTAGAYPAGAMVLLEFDGSVAQLRSGGNSGGGILVTQNQVLTVPSALYPDIVSAVLAFSKMVPAAGVLITINIVPPTPGVPYQETRTAQNGPIDIRLPYGNQLQIVAPPLNGNFPSQADLVGKTKAQVLSLLQGRFNCIISCVAVDGIQIHSGGINLLKNVLVVGDGTAGCSPIRIGDWQNDIGTGFLGAQGVWTHGGGQHGVFAMFGGYVRANNLGSSYNAQDGMRSAHGCNIEINFGSLISMFNGGSGIYAANDGQISVDSSSGTMDAAYNGQHGMAAVATGKFNLLPATSVRLNNNGGWAGYAFGQGLGNLPSFTSYGGNGSGDLYSGLNSDITALGSNAGTCSPARNSIGNYNSTNIV